MREGNGGRVMKGGGEGGYGGGEGSSGLHLATTASSPTNRPALQL